METGKHFSTLQTSGWRQNHQGRKCLISHLQSWRNKIPY